MRTSSLDGPFLWGTATSAHQVEGGNAGNDWAREPRVPPAGDSCAFRRHFHEDLDRARWLGTNAFRFSLEWSRVEPRPGERDPAAVAYYDDLIDACLERGLRPMLTLVQFTLPAWCAPRKLAWLRDDVQDAFARHAAWVGARYGDRVDLFVTFNEPNVQAGAGYLGGVFPPGIRLRPDLADRCQAALLRAHVRAYHALRTAAPRDVAVGVSPHVVAWHRSRADLGGLVWRAMQSFNWAFLDALDTGELRLATLRRELPEARGCMDFVGLNQFMGLPATLPAVLRFAGLLARRDDPQASDIGWPPDSSGFEAVLREAHTRYGMPILVTENGVADAEDALRPGYLLSYLAALRRARAAGVDVRGYFHWSLIDNYEWHEGFAPRFGLFEVDYATQQRRPRPSATLYRKLIAETRLAMPTIGTPTPAEGAA